MKNARILGIAALALLVALPVLAEPSAKQTAQVGNVAVLKASADIQPAGSDPIFEPIFSQTLKTSQQKRVFIDVSLECGLYTKTQVKGKGGSKSTAAAEASVLVRVLVDGVEAAPGHVVFCKRFQELSAVLGGVLEECTDADGDGTITLDDCSFTDEEIQLVLDTMGAHAFNFISQELVAGTHLIEVEAAINATAGLEEGDGAAEANATIGKGSMTVEEVRLAVNDEIQL